MIAGPIAASLRFVCLILLLCLVSSPLFAENSPAFWRVEDGNSQIYLFGSMHFGDHSFYPLPAEVENAYRRADALAVEIDLTSLDLSAMSSLYQRYAALSQGQTLKSLLGEKLYGEFIEFCQSNDISPEAFEIWQPWFIALQLVQMELSRSSWKPNLGIDMHFLQKGDKPIIELESIDAQFALLGGFSAQEQRLFLQQTLTDLKQSQHYLSQLGQAWKKGDTALLEALLTESFQKSDAGKSIYKKFFIDRNKTMAEKAAGFLKEDKRVFIVVGAGHMVGSGGIVDLLQRRGYQIERIGKGPANARQVMPKPPGRE